MKVGEENAQVYRLAIQQSGGPVQISSAIPYTATYQPGIFLHEAIRLVFEGSDPQIALTAAQGKAEIYLNCLDLQGLAAMNNTEVEEIVNRCMEKAGQTMN